jgi:FtsH-binding integral membrane protein
LNAAQKQFVRTFSLAVASIIVWAIGWEYFPDIRVWLTIFFVVINSPGLLRDIQKIRNTNSRYDPDRFVGLAARKPWIAWMMGVYGISAIVFLILALTRRIEVADIGFLQFILMLAPLGIPGTVIHYENLRDE